MQINYKNILGVTPRGRAFRSYLFAKTEKPAKRISAAIPNAGDTHEMQNAL